MIQAEMDQANSRIADLNELIENDIPKGPGETAERAVATALTKIPIVGFGGTAKEFKDIWDSALRVSAGSEDPRDIAVVTQWIRDETADPTALAIATGILIEAPVFMTEFGLTGPAASSAKAGLRKLVGDAVAQRMKRSLGKRVAGVAGFTALGAAGAAGRTVAIPRLTLDSAMRRAMPDVESKDFDTVAKMFAQQDDSFTEQVLKNIPSGVLDAYIEVASESVGGGLQHAIGGIKAKIFQGWLKANPNGKAAQFFRQLGELGWNGLIIESFEERVGEVARGVTGLEEDFGVTGGLAQLATTGKMDPDIAKQFLGETLGLLGMSSAFAVPGTAARILDEKVVSKVRREDQAGEQRELARQALGAFTEGAGQVDVTGTGVVPTTAPGGAARASDAQVLASDLVNNPSVAQDVEQLAQQEEPVSRTQLNELLRRAGLGEARTNQTQRNILQEAIRQNLDQATSLRSAATRRDLRRMGRKVEQERKQEEGTAPTQLPPPVQVPASVAPGTLTPSQSVRVRENNDDLGMGSTVFVEFPDGSSTEGTVTSVADDTVTVTFDPQDESKLPQVNGVGDVRLRDNLIGDGPNTALVFNRASGVSQDPVTTAGGLSAVLQQEHERFVPDRTAKVRNVARGHGIPFIEAARLTIEDSVTASVQRANRAYRTGWWIPSWLTSPQGGEDAGEHRHRAGASQGYRVQRLRGVR
jgi:hypothetical protein